MSSSDESSTDSRKHAKSWASWKSRRSKAAKALASSRKRESFSSTRKEDASPSTVGFSISMPALSSESEVRSGSCRELFSKNFLSGCSCDFKVPEARQEASPHSQEKDPQYFFFF